MNVDMGYFTDIGAQHLAYLKKMNLDSLNKKQLMFHIDSHEIDVDIDSIKVEVDPKRDDVNRNLNFNADY